MDERQVRRRDRELEIEREVERGIARHEGLCHKKGMSVHLNI